MEIDIDRIIERSGDPERGRADLARFDEAFAYSIGGRVDWGRAPALLRIFGNSRVLAGRLIANPGWVDEIAESPGPKERPQIEAELSAAVASSAGDQAAFDAAIRRFKYRELTRLISRDICGEMETRELLAEWSDIADALIDAAYRRAHGALSVKLGWPLASDGSPCHGTVVALGKLGGRELNISSDIDILIIYGSDEGGATSASGRVTTNHEWYVKLTSEMTKLLATVTADGFVFRVDHELRPEGPQGPLANSLDAALRYYEYFGRDWERQAMIRARTSAGNPELGRLFVDGLRPFVYRRTMGLSELTHMREMKGQMADKAALRGTSFDAKHGVGGIREAEFLVQAIQVLHGGAHPSVRRQNTFDAVDALEAEHLIHPHGSALLLRSYSFLRRLENMIQCESDIQTHRVPDDEAGERALARRMGFEGGGEASNLRAEISRHTRGISRLFNAIFEADYERQELEDALEDNLSRAKDEEEQADSLAWFRQSETKRLAALDLEGAMGLQRLLRRLTIVSEVVVAFAWRMAQTRLVQRYGTPRTSNGEAASFAIVGMGRMGSMELDYGSDLDLIFLYSGAGQTDGQKPVSNVEFFTRLAQRIISIISLSTRYGRAYAVDSELRPSGRSGTLVATLESFMGYHSGDAEVWEKLALLKARAVAGDRAFMDETNSAIAKLAFLSEPPPEDSVRCDIDRLRSRTIEERAAKKGGAVNVKIGRGGLADLESAIQFLHLMHSRLHESLQRQNTFEVIDSLAAEEIIDAAAREEWLDHFSFFRKLISRIRLVAGGSIDLFDPRSPHADILSRQFGFDTPTGMANEVERRRGLVRRIYDEVIAK